jgi:hypothetical protein
LAKPDAEDIANALAILGVAALAHNEHHYRNGYAPTTGDETAQFEAGYRDGLHNAPFATNYPTNAYSEGYAAGAHDREANLSHGTRHADIAAGRSHDVPRGAVQGCTGEVSSSFAVSARDVHIRKAQATNRATWNIEASVGHKYVVCEANEAGVVMGMRDGRL